MLENVTQVAICASSAKEIVTEIPVVRVISSAPKEMALKR
jgi:hypothetical protein